MFDYNTVVAIVFRIINFCLFIGICVYLFRKKVLPSAYADINEKEVFLKGLSEQRFMLENQQYELEQKIIAQEELGKRLLDKVVRWHGAKEVQQLTRFQEQKVRSAVIQQRTAQKYDYINQHALEQQALKMVLVQLRNQLYAKFVDSPQATTYMHELVGELKREIQ